MADKKTDRREFLRWSSLLPLAVASNRSLLAAESSSAEPNTLSCEAVDQHRPVAEDDPVFTEAQTALWNEFVAGIGIANPGNPPDVPQATKDHIFDQQGRRLRRKTKFWLVCEFETRMCAVMAGAIAEGLREASGHAAMTVDDFDTAKTMVQRLQRRRLGRANIGIAC
jgi:hypothetical protein